MNITLTNPLQVVAINNIEIDSLMSFRDTKQFHDCIKYQYLSIGK